MSTYNFKDLTDQRYGKWTVLERDVITQRPPTNPNVYWWCECECGTRKSVMGMTLRNGRSAGCRRCWEHGHKHNFCSRLWHRIIRNAKLRGIAVDLGEKTSAKAFLYDLLHNKQQGRCALSRVQISIANTQQGDMVGETTASLDRINSNKGYTRDNVQWVHKDINKMKQDLDQAVFIRWCQEVAKSATAL